MELLDKFSHHVRVTKIDQKYKEQYLDTIKQLVQEQVSTIQYSTVQCSTVQYKEQYPDPIKQLVQEQVKINTTSTSHNVVIIQFLQF